MAPGNGGTAVPLISEDLDEILDLADRIVVMQDGQIAHEAGQKAPTRKRLAATCSGTTDAGRR